MFIYWFVFPEFNVLYDDDAPAAVATDYDDSIFFLLKLVIVITLNVKNWTFCAVWVICKCYPWETNILSGSLVSFLQPFCWEKGQIFHII